METIPPSDVIRVRKKLQAGTVFVFCLVLSGCIGATPLPKRTRTPAGTEVKNLDLTFMHPGKTTRAEVSERLKLIDTGYQGGHFFLGRWSSSTWGGWAVIAAMPPGGFVGGGRVWKSGNLLVEFDDAGIVKRVEVFDDSKALRHLSPVAADTPLLLTSPVELPVKYSKLRNGQLVDAKIVLSTSTFDFEELGTQKKRHKFSVPAADFLRVETPVTLPDPDPIHTIRRLRFTRDLKKIGGPGGKDLNVEVTLPQLVMLMTYAAQAGKSAPGGTAAEGDRR
jgi:hypothetical protein